MTQADLAAAIGVSRYHIVKCEDGRADIGTAALQRACEVLDVTPGYLIDPAAEGAEEAECEPLPSADPEVCFSAEGLAGRLREARMAEGLTQQAAADRYGTTQANYAKYEHGCVTPRADSLVRLAGALGTSVDYLLGLEEAPPQRLTDEEDALLGFFRASPTRLREALLTTAEAFAGTG